MDKDDKEFWKELYGKEVADKMCKISEEYETFIEQYIETLNQIAITHRIKKRDTLPFLSYHIGILLSPLETRDAFFIAATVLGVLSTRDDCPEFTINLKPTDIDPSIR